VERKMRDEKDEDVIVAGIDAPNKEPLVEIFPTSTDSLTIASNTIGLSGIGPQPDYVEIVRKEVDRGKFHGEGEIEIFGVFMDFMGMLTHFNFSWVACPFKFS